MLVAAFQLPTVVLIAFSSMTASANEQIASRYDPTLKTERPIYRTACTDSEVASCKTALKACYERCAKAPDINQRAFASSRARTIPFAVTKPAIASP